MPKLHLLASLTTVAALAGGLALSTGAMARDWDDRGYRDGPPPRVDGSRYQPRERIIYCDRGDRNCRVYWSKRPHHRPDKVRVIRDRRHYPVYVERHQPRWDYDSRRRWSDHGRRGWD